MSADAALPLPGDDGLAAVERWQHTNNEHLAAALHWLRLRLQRLAHRGRSRGRRSRTGHAASGAGSRIQHDTAPPPVVEWGPPVAAHTGSGGDSASPLSGGTRTVGGHGRAGGRRSEDGRTRTRRGSAHAGRTCRAVRPARSSNGLCSCSVHRSSWLLHSEGCVQPHRVIPRWLIRHSLSLSCCSTTRRGSRCQPNSRCAGARLIEVSQAPDAALVTSPYRADERVVNYLKGLNELTTGWRPTSCRWRRARHQCRRHRHRRRSPSASPIG